MALSGIDFLSTIDFQLKNMWDFILIDDPTDIFSSIESFNSGLTNSSLMFRCTSINIPQLKFSTTENVAGIKYYTEVEYPTNISLTYLEDTSFSCYQTFKKWMESVYDYNLGVWKKNSPVKTGIAIFYSGNLPTAFFSIRGLKILSIEDFDLSRTDSGPLTNTITLSCERVDPIFSPNILAQIKNYTQIAISSIERRL